MHILSTRVERGVHLGHQVGLEAEQVAAPIILVQVVEILVNEQLWRSLTKVGLRQAVPAASRRPPRPLVPLRYRAEVQTAPSNSGH